MSKEGKERIRIKKVEMIRGILIGIIFITSCTTVNTVNRWVAEQNETYIEVERGKLTNTAFADDYDNKLVVFKASFYGLLNKPKVRDYNPKEYLGVGLGTYAHDTAPLQFYNIAQRKMYDTLSKLKRLDSVQVWGRAFKLTKGTLGLYIHKIEKIKD